MPLIEEVRFLSTIADYTYGTSIESDAIDIEIDNGDILAASMSVSDIRASVIDDNIDASIVDTEVSRSIDIDNVTISIKYDKEN